MRNKDSKRDDLPLQKNLAGNGSNDTISDLPSSAPNNSDLMALLNGEREILDHGLADAKNLVTVTEEAVSRYLPMVCGDVVEFNLTLTWPLGRRSLVFGNLVFDHGIRCEVLDPCNASNVCLKLCPE